MKKLSYIANKLFEYAKLAVFILILLVRILYLMLIKKLRGQKASLTAIILEQIIGFDKNNEGEHLKPVSEIYLKRKVVTFCTRPPSSSSYSLVHISEKKSFRRVRLNDITNFAEYFEIGKLLNLSDRQARVFAGIALNFTRKELIEISQSKSSTIDGMKRDMAKKLGFSKYRGKIRDRKIKEFAEAYLKTDYQNILSLSSKKIDEDKRISIAKNKVIPRIPTIIDRKILKNLSEKERIYQTVMDNPYLLEEINRLNPPQ